MSSGENTRISADLVIGQSFHSNAWAPGKPTAITIILEAKETGDIEIKMTDIEENVVKEGCRIQLLENSAANNVQM